MMKDRADANKEYQNAIELAKRQLRSIERSMVLHEEDFYGSPVIDYSYVGDMESLTADLVLIADRIRS